MEKVILKSMVDFVLEQDEEPILGLISHDYRKIRRYANFLNKPLNLGMFVPCDSKGNVLVEPKNTYLNDLSSEESTHRLNLLKEYQEAKDRVIFDGFEVFRSVSALISFSKVKNGLGRLDWNKEGNFMMGYTEESTIEDLYNSHYTDLELTPTAQKQLKL